METQHLLKQIFSLDYLNICKRQISLKKIFANIDSSIKWLFSNILNIQGVPRNMTVG